MNGVTIVLINTDFPRAQQMHPLCAALRGPSWAGRIQGPTPLLLLAWRLGLEELRARGILSPYKTFIWTGLYLFPCGDFPQALLSSLSGLILLPFCATFASGG